jgi:hypothetical protein
MVEKLSKVTKQTKASEWNGYVIYWDGTVEKETIVNGERARELVPSPAKISSKTWWQAYMIIDGRAPALTRHTPIIERAKVRAAVLRSGNASDALDALKDLD